MKGQYSDEKISIQDQAELTSIDAIQHESVDQRIRPDYHAQHSPTSKKGEWWHIRFKSRSTVVKQHTEGGSDNYVSTDAASQSRVKQPL